MKKVFYLFLAGALSLTFSNSLAAQNHPAAKSDAPNAKPATETKAAVEKQAKEVRKMEVQKPAAPAKVEHTATPEKHEAKAEKATATATPNAEQPKPHKAKKHRAKVEAPAAEKAGTAK